MQSLASTASSVAVGPGIGTQLYIHFILNLVPVVVLYYDYLLTLAREIEFFWPPKNRLGWASSLLLINRYVSIIGHIPILKSYLVLGGFSFCQKLYPYHTYYEVVLQIIVGALCIFRVYALYNKSRKLLVTLLTMSFAAVGIACWRLIGGGGVQTVPVDSPNFPGCSQMLSHSGGKRLSTAWSGVLVFDTAIFILTWYQALKIGGGVPLLTVLVRDGTMYFVVLSLLNLTNVLTLLLAPPLMKDSATTLTNVFSTVLMSRLMINLRTKSEPGRWRGQSTISTSMSFCDPAAPTAAISTTFQLGTHDSSGSSALASTSKHSQEPEAIELKDLTGAQPQQLAAVQEEPV